MSSFGPRALVANVSATSVFCPQGYRERRKELRYGRRLKGATLVSSRRPLPGTTSVSTNDDDKRSLRIPRNAENTHLLVAGDTGSGKFEPHPARR
jgi:hypothetical protein